MKSQKTYKAIGKQEVLTEVYVVAASKTEAARKIRQGDVLFKTELTRPIGYHLGGGGYANIEEVSHKQANSTAAD